MFEELFGKSGLSLERLQTLCEIAEKGSIGEATKGDSNRQTQYSRQIGELEKFFGVDLLNRDSRPYRLSEDGRTLANISRAYLGSLSDFLANCEDRPTRLVIGGGESILQWLLAPMLGSLSEKMPDATIAMRNLRTKEITQSLLDGEIDLGLVRRSAVTRPLKFVTCSEYRYRLFVPKRMRVKLPEKPRFSHLVDLPLAVIEGTGDFRQQMSMQASEEGTSLNIQLECSSYAQIANAILSGGYCGFLPHFASQFLPENRFNSFDIVGLESLKRDLVFAWNPKHRALRPAIDQLVTMLERHE